GHTTLDAPRGRVVQASLTDPAPAAWLDLVPEGDDVIEGIAVTRDSLLVASARSAIVRLRHLPLAGLPEPGASEGGAVPSPIEIRLPEPGSIAGLAADRDTDTAVVAFTSWTRPPELWAWRPGTAVTRVSDLPSPVDPARYRVAVDRYPS